MRTTLVIGTAAGAALGMWNVVTMLWPVPYGIWELGRGGLFIGFLVALVVLAASAAGSGAPARRAFAAVTGAGVVAACLTLTSYVLLTYFLADRIVQLPEFLRDYTYHGYSSPKVYLADHYRDLLGLQVFSWAVGLVGLVLVAGSSGWCLGRLGQRLRS